MMRCIAIDDEPLALRQIAGYIEKTPFLELVAACPGATEALETLSRHEADLLFVDINMPDLNGLDFVRSLAVKPLVIFTTAYSQYAVEGFRVDALDYLLKPVSYADFLKSSEKALHRFRLLTASSDRTPPVVQPVKLFVKTDYKQVQVDIPSITHVESYGEYVRIHTVTGSPVVTLSNMKNFEDRLPRESFMRVHRSYIVNLDRISEVERSHIIIGTTRIPIGDQYRDAFRSYLASKSLTKQ